MADVLTFEEHRGAIRGRTIAWVGDANNVLASWVQAAARFDFALRVATPPQLDPRSEVLDWAKRAGAAGALIRDPVEAVADAGAGVTECWVSLGGGDEGSRHNLLRPYQVTAKLRAAAGRDAILMH